ncbi:MAG: hypothetical protein RI988_2029 [Pseudomonadota bacterium]|jgi:hypothetical protein
MTPGFRHEFRNLTPADTLTVLGWLLEPAQGDPDPDLPDDMIDALQPLHAAYRKAYSALCAATGQD